MPIKKAQKDKVNDVETPKVKDAPIEEKPVVADVEAEAVIDEPETIVAAVQVEEKPVLQQRTHTQSNPNTSPSPIDNTRNNNLQRRNVRPSMGNNRNGGNQSSYNNYNNNNYNNNGNNYNYNNNNNSTNNANLDQAQNFNAVQANGDSTYYNGEVIAIKGMLEVLPDYGVIRQDSHPYDNVELPKDVYISQSQIRRFNLRMGDLITGFARPPKEGERYLSLLRVEKVAEMDPEDARKRPHFSKLTPIFPNEWLKLETTSDILSTRLIDLVAPIGKGQRAMIVAPPKAGKTWLLKDVANGITENHPEVVLLVALIGERPEEVTHFARSVKGEVFSSNFDDQPSEQARISEICLERAKRLAETGKDVVILMDSLTRLARAYNMVAPPSGRTLTGGFDPAALYPAKHFFGAARKLEEGGSLTIISTALVDTGSRMDDVIFEEFKGTGNMELRLDSTLYERRIFPTIDIKGSGTRHEEYLLNKETLDKILRLRRMVDLLGDKDATELVIERLKKSKTNADFLENLHKA